MNTSKILLACSIAVTAAVGAMPILATARTGPVLMLSQVPMSEDAMVRPEVRSECQLGTQIPRWIVAAGGGQVATADQLPDSGSVLQIEILDAGEQGNAWTGRHKSLTIKGELREDGAVVGTFRARRSTTGGFMGQYKGNCSFFHRCAKTLGQDVVRWLANPTMNAMLGD